MRKLLCFLCALVLLPVSCFAWSSPDGSPRAFDFDFGFEVDPDAFPEDDCRTATGYGELLNRVRISGTYIMAGDGSNCYDLQLILSVADKKRAEIPLRFFGSNNDMYITSPFLGDETLFMNLNGWLKIALKAYDYFEIPLQEPALLLPYATEFGERGLRYFWAEQFPDGKTVKLNQKNLLQLAADLRKLLNEDEDLADWLNAIGIRSGFSSVIMEETETLEDWVRNQFPEGLSRTVTKKGETWASGDRTVCTRTSENGSESLEILLPPTDQYGLVTEIHSRKQPAGNGNDLEMTAKIASDTENWLNLNLFCANLPETFPFTEPFTMEFRTSGYLTGDADLTVTGEITGEHGLTVTLFLKDPETGEARPAVRCSGTATARTGDPNPTYDHSKVYESVYLTALTDYTLSELMNNIAGPMVRGMLPVLIQIPTISCQVILDQLTEHGVLNLLSGDLDLSR